MIYIATAKNLPKHYTCLAIKHGQRDGQNCHEQRNRTNFVKEVALVPLQVEDDNVFEKVNHVEISNEEKLRDLTLRRQFTHTPVNKLQADV